MKRGAHIVFGLASVLSAAACASMQRVDASSTARPHLIVARIENLEESKRRIEQGDAALMPAYRALIKSADSALGVAPISVTQKHKTPPSGDKRDFMSLAPYWWPDSTKLGGLPYIRRDGDMNPESRLDHDGIRFQSMEDVVQALALAYFFTGNEKYAAHASTMLHVFFVDSVTRMNPNLRFAQAVPGVNDGRGIGIIDTRVIPQLLDAIRLLEASPSLPIGDRAALTKWSRDYLTWLRDSKNGKDERAADNNHGTWYDAQAAALALFVGDSAFAKQVINVDAKARIADHILPNGSQPRELARTRPIHYSLFNLDPYSQLAEMSRHVGGDLWHYEAANGGSLENAFYYIAPYTDSTIKWKMPEQIPLTAEDFASPLRRAAVGLQDPALSRAITRLNPAVQSGRERLLYPSLPEFKSSKLDSLEPSVLAFASSQLLRAATALDPTAGYPRATLSNGGWQQQPANSWTSGFFAGTLWYMFQLTRGQQWRSLAERWTSGLESDKSITTTHDVGFMIFNTFGHAYLLTDEPRDSAIVLEASRSLSTRFNARVGAIKSWDTQSVTDARQAWQYPVIIDNIMNLPLLFWAGSHGGDSTWTSIALSHSIVSASSHVRPDGSVAHVALFDPASGHLLRNVTWQGYSDSSAWSRGQAWAIHGFTAAYSQSRRPELLHAAELAADYFLSNVPDDGVPYWDFNVPDKAHAERDASAAAIAASGLLDLARWSKEPRRTRYRKEAATILTTLSTNYIARGTPNASILIHSVGSHPQNSEVDVGIVYADYYFIEALLRRRGLFLE